MIVATSVGRTPPPSGNAQKPSEAAGSAVSMASVPCPVAMGMSSLATGTSQSVSSSGAVAQTASTGFTIDGEAKIFRTRASRNAWASGSPTSEGLIAASTAPMTLRANHQTIASGQFGMARATFSPRFTPWAASQAAAAPTRARNSPNETGSPPRKLMKGASGVRSARASSAGPSVQPSASRFAKMSGIVVPRTSKAGARWDARCKYLRLAHRLELAVLDRHRDQRVGEDALMLVGAVADLAVHIGAFIVADGFERVANLLAGHLAL